MNLRLKNTLKAPKRRATPDTVKAVAPSKKGAQLLDRYHNDPTKQLPIQEVIIRVVALSQVLAEKKFYPYQVELASRIVESLLEHDGEVITALMARQAGKTETLGSVVAAIALIFPQLAKQYPQDWRLNITDSGGVYRGFAYGIKIGIYAPILEQSDIMFQRVKKCMQSDSGKNIIKELGLILEQDNGGKVKLSNHSVIVCSSASEQSKIEGQTYHFLVLEECQDITDLKIRKSLHPMVAATLGTIVKIGTASTKKCDFYTSIKNNQRFETLTGKRNHFCYPYTVCVKYNSFYSKHIEKEKVRLGGEDADEFRTSYCCEWIFERGMFVTQEQLFNRETALTYGNFDRLYPDGLPPAMRRFSLVAGIDWGASYDSTVVTVVAVDWEHPFDAGFEMHNGEEGYYTYYRKHVINWMEFLGDNYEYQFGEIVAYLSSLPGLRRIVTDANTCGKPIFDRLVSVFKGSSVEVIPFTFQAKTKSDGYKEFYSDLCGKRFTFPAGQDARATKEYKKFVMQMLDLRKEYKNGLMAVAHPEEKGAHDDYPDSAMLANFGANSPVLGNISVEAGNPFLNRN